VVPEIPCLALVYPSGKQREIIDHSRVFTQGLGDEDGGADGLADAALLVVHDETEADDASGAHIAVPARPVGHPLQSFRAHRAGVVHGRRGSGDRSRRRRGRGREG